MRFLLHGELPEGIADDLTGLGHTCVKPAEVGLPGKVGASSVLKAARVNQLDIITADRDFAANAYDIRRSVVYLQSTADQPILRLFARYKRLSPGQLYTVNETGVKVRQLPHQPAAD